MQQEHHNVGHNKPFVSERKSNVKVENYRCHLQISKCHSLGRLMSVGTKFQVDSCPEVRRHQSVFDLFSLSDAEVHDDHPKIDIQLA